LTSYLPRIVDAELDELLAALPAVALEGPKGVGKTETVKRRAKTVTELDAPAQQAIAKADAAQVVKREKPILPDEWYFVIIPCMNSPWKPQLLRNVLVG